MSESSTHWATFYIPGLDCPEELRLIHNGLSNLQGIRQLRPDYLERSLKIEFEAARLQRDRIVQRLSEIGFPTQDKPASLESPTAVWRHTTTAGAVLLVMAIIVWWVGASNAWIGSLAVGSTLLSGWHVLLAGGRALRLRRMDMNALMAIAAIGALLTGEWFEAATAMLLFSASLWIEQLSTRRADQALRSLIQVMPRRARRVQLTAANLDQLNDQSYTEIDVDQIARDDILLVRPGERIPVDGVVTHGDSAVNQATITGESIPESKTTGDTVYGGSINQDGSLLLRATTTSDDSTMSQIVSLVSRARTTRAPTERFVDQFARIYTPIIIGLAAFVTVVPPLFMLVSSSLSTVDIDPPLMAIASAWLHRGLVLLVTACPCALVLSTPITIVCGLHQAARSGILIKGGDVLESLGKLRCIAIDKTGTLTHGTPHVARIATNDSHTEDEVLRIAGSIEQNSEHPMAEAIVQAAACRNVRLASPEAFRALLGRGVEATLEGKSYMVGSPRMFEQDSNVDQERIDSFALGSLEASVVLVGTRDELFGALYLTDTLREEATQAIADWREQNITRVAMLTGDRFSSAEPIASAIGIKEIYAQLMPEDKLRIIKRLSREQPIAAMVGDGVNDAPALAAATVSIAMGQEPSDTAMETADVAMTSGNLNRVTQALRIGHKTRRVLYQNIAFSLGVKAIVLLLICFDSATMWMAVAADVGASLLVIANALRVLR